MRPHRFIPLLLTLGVALSLASCEEKPLPLGAFSCDDVRRLNIWRARVFDNFSAAGAIANAHDPQAKNPDITARRLRDLQLQLAHYFQNEPMPDCLQKAIRIYVDGARELQKDNGNLLVVMKRYQVTVDRFTEEVSIAKPEWVQDTAPAKQK